MKAMPADEAATPAGPPQPYRWTVLGGVWLVYFSFGLTVSSMAPLVGAITGSLGIGNAQMGIILGAWQLIYIASAVPCGALLDRAGPRVALLLSCLIMAASGVLRGFAPDFLTMFVAVAAFGLGGPLISVGAPKVIAQWFEGRDRGFAMGVYVTGPAFGAMAALSLTNGVLMPLADGDWRLVMFAYAAIVMASGLVWLLVTAHPAAREMERRRAAEPRRPQLQVFGSLLRLRAVQLMLVMSVGIFFLNHGMNAWLPEILVSRGLDAAAAGYLASVPVAVGIVGSLVIPRFAVPHRRMAILGGLFVTVGAATVLLQNDPGAALLLGLVFQGVARGSLMTLAMLVLVETKEVGAHNAGAAGGLFFSAAEIGGVLGPLGIGWISDTSGGFDASLWLLTGLCAALLLMLLRLRRL